MTHAPNLTQSAPGAVSSRDNADEGFVVLRGVNTITAPPPASGATRVLVVEDGIIVAEDTRRRLMSMGYIVVGTAATGEEAIAAVARLQPDIVLMDIRLGTGMDGIAAAGEIRRAHGTPVIFATAYSDDATLERAKASGPLGYILKPFDPRELKTIIELSLLRHRNDLRLRSSEELYRCTLESAPDGILRMDLQGGIVLANRRAAELLGAVDAVALESRNLLELSAEIDRPPLLEAILNVLKNAVAGGITIRAGCEEARQRTLDLRLSPLEDAHRRTAGCVAILRAARVRRERKRASEKPAVEPSHQ
jgi:PAS domain S-box-containing protein